MIQTKDEDAFSSQKESIPTEHVISEQEKEQKHALKGEHLYSLLLKLRAKASGILQPSAGELAQAALLHWFAAVDETLSACLHIPNQRRPFTCSSLWESTRHASGETSIWDNRPLRVAAGGVYWLRVTLLSECLFRPFMTRYLQAASVLDGKGQMILGLPSFQLGQIDFDVVELLSSPSASNAKHESVYTDTWSGHTTYQDMLQTALAVEDAASRKIGFEFCSPTAFSDSQGAWKHQMYRFPSPERVFGNLARSWNEWAPSALRIDQKTLQTYCQRWVDISEYELRTEMLPLTHAPQKGFLGWCIYSIMNKGTDIFEEGDRLIVPGMAALSPEKTLHLLQQFSFYAGLGTKTVMGMGQVRPYAVGTKKKITANNRL
jgi:CRISPR-associated endoribonuclease Cas6